MAGIQSTRKPADSPSKTCTRSDCDRPLRAKGLCGTHYNRLNPNRHRKVAVTCDCCRASHLRDARNEERYAGRYCSQLCRDFTYYGHSLSSPIPPNHWARNFGKTSAWTPPVRYTINCAWCGAERTSSFSRVKYCSVPCSRRHKNSIRRAREFDAAGEYSWMDITKLWQQFDRRCAYCTTPTALSAIQAEHVKALSRGGANNKTNLLPSCASCNSDKRELTLSEWEADRARRGMPRVKTSWSNDDKRYAHLVM